MCSDHFMYKYLVSNIAARFCCINNEIYCIRVVLRPQLVKRWQPFIYQAASYRFCVNFIQIKLVAIMAS